MSFELLTKRARSCEEKYIALAKTYPGRTHYWNRNKANVMWGYEWGNSITSEILKEWEDLVISHENNLRKIGEMIIGGNREKKNNPNLKKT